MFDFKHIHPAMCLFVKEVYLRALSSVCFSTVSNAKQQLQKSGTKLKQQGGFLETSCDFFFVGNVYFQFSSRLVCLTVYFSGPCVQCIMFLSGCI